MMKRIVQRLLEIQAKRFLKHHKPRLVAIAGSVGKTSTKLFTATVLGQRYRVHTQQGNYNMEISVPLAIFDLPVPGNIKSPFSWLAILWYMELKIHRHFPFDVILLELATDKPGDIKRFSRYVRPDIGVITAVAPEHMESFKSIDAVAKEELGVANFSKLALINRDDIDSAFAQYVTNSNIDTYGTSGVAEYHFLIDNFDIEKGFAGKFVSPEYGEQAVVLQIAGEHNIKAAVAAGTVGIKLGLSAPEIVQGLGAIKPVNGRMHLLKGLLKSTLIDDTYNSSPSAAVAALQALYAFPHKQKIAILGSMNELGEFSQKAHEQVGSMCDPTLMDWIVTIGDEAEKYLAPAAASRGCQVRSFKSPYEAGGFVHSILSPGAAVLAKGSQNGVFAEEALKVLLHSTEEESQLVRQSPEWLAKKAAMFDKFASPIAKK